MRLVVKFPTRGRPDKFVDVLNRYINMASGMRDVHYVISMDHDDPSMNNQNIIGHLERLNQRMEGRIHFAYGASKGKIEACNANLDIVRRLNPHVILLASDDMIPIVSGYDDIICKDMARHFPDTDGVLHYNDGFSGQDKLITLSILGMKYFNRFGYLYNPEYKSVFCDDEFTQVARLLNKVVYSDRCIIQHQWVGIPYSMAANGKLNPNEIRRDFLHERNESQEMYSHDRPIFERRKAENFGIAVKEDVQNESTAISN
jgi:hypothetical protein